MSVFHELFAGNVGHDPTGGAAAVVVVEAIVVGAEVDTTTAVVLVVLVVLDVVVVVDVMAVVDVDPPVGFALLGRAAVDDRLAVASARPPASDATQMPMSAHAASVAPAADRFQTICWVIGRPHDDP